MFVPKSLNQKDSQWSGNTLTKEKVPGSAVSKEGLADSLQGHERIYHYWFLWTKCDCKQCFLLPTPFAKFTLFIEWLFIEYWFIVYLRSNISLHVFSNIY